MCIRDSLQTVCDKGHEHRRRVKEQIAQESADAAYRKRGERIEQNGGGRDFRVFALRSEKEMCIRDRLKVGCD